MCITMPTVITLVLVAAGTIVSTPVLFRGFKRRGKGVKYEENFIIQRLPQLAALANVVWIILGFLGANGLFADSSILEFGLSQKRVLPIIFANIIDWAGVIVLLSGLIFMIGGWYSLGEAFSTDAELLHGQTIKNTGLLRFVMHPAYSGIIQSLLGASLAAVSLPSFLFTLMVVAPLWLNRAKYEEKLLVETFGESYIEYGQGLKWRRLIPSFFPIGI